MSRRKGEGKRGRIFTTLFTRTFTRDISIRSAKFFSWNRFKPSHASWIERESDVAFISSCTFPIRYMHYNANFHLSHVLSYSRLKRSRDLRSLRVYVLDYLWYCIMFFLPLPSPPPSRPVFPRCCASSRAIIFESFHRSFHQYRFPCRDKKLTRSTSMSSEYFLRRAYRKKFLRRFLSSTPRLFYRPPPPPSPFIRV